MLNKRRQQLNAGQRKYGHTVKGKYTSYKNGARKRDLAFELTLEEFAVYWQADCWYCGYKIKTIGLDRINNDYGYLKDNVRSCCQWCNKGKGELTATQWVALCSNVVRKHGGLIYGNV